MLGTFFCVAVSGVGGGVAVVAAGGGCRCCAGKGFTQNLQCAHTHPTFMTKLSLGLAWFG